MGGGDDERDAGLELSTDDARLSSDKSSSSFANCFVEYVKMASVHATRHDIM